MLDYLEFSEDYQIIPLREPKLKAMFIQNNTITTKTVSSTAKLFGNITQLAKGIYPNSLPCPLKIPDYLKNAEKIIVFILVLDNLTQQEKENFVKILKTAFGIYNNMRDVWIEFKIPMPYFDFRKKIIYFENSKKGISEAIKKINNICKNHNIDFNTVKFAFIFGKRSNNDFDYYQPLKKALFDNHILSQNILVDDTKSLYAYSNIIYDMLTKLGYKFLALEKELPYDYILGVDVGYSEAYTGRVACCTAIFDSNGLLKNLIPISIENFPNSESARIGELLRRIDDSLIYNDINFSNSRILLLRDGYLQRREIKELEEFSKERDCEITYIGVKKNIPFQLFVSQEENNNKRKFIYYPLCVRLGDIYLLCAHKTTYGYPRFIKIHEKYEIKNGIGKKTPISEKDINIIYQLTALNHSSVGNPSNLRLPCPIYYSDMLAKALKKGWKLREELLKEGVLYFI
ncbi:Piwi domain-containing protein [Methanocaldococcus sp. 16A]